MNDGRIVGLKIRPHLLADVTVFFSLAKFPLVVIPAFAPPALASAPAEANLARDRVLARLGVLSIAWAMKT